MKRSLVCTVAALSIASFGCGAGSPAEATNPTTGPEPTSAGTATVAAPIAAPRQQLSADDAPPSGGSGACEISQYATWPSCVGTVVTLTGRDPGPNVLQHPGSVDPPEPDKSIQQYMDVPGATQVVLLVKQRTTCPGNMQATGTLRAVQLSGTVGKETYSGWVLAGAQVKCL